MFILSNVGVIYYDVTDIGNFKRKGQKQILAVYAARAKLSKFQ